MEFSLDKTRFIVSNWSSEVRVRMSPVCSVRSKSIYQATVGYRLKNIALIVISVTIKYSVRYEGFTHYVFVLIISTDTFI